MRSSRALTRIDAPRAVGLPFAGLSDMVIPHRDWLLLRGRMRAAAKISVLPMLLKPFCVAEPDDRDEEEADKVEERRDA